MTDFTLTDEELGLFKRVLSFATHNIPIQDALGNRIFPTAETRRLALDLENRLEEAGVPTPGGLFSAYDPLALAGKKATIRYYAENNVEYNVNGVVSEVLVDESDPLEPAYTVVMADGSHYQYKNREDLQANSRVELEQG
jgi:hypothetical protein